MNTFADIRRQFPLLDQENLIYLDTAASSQKPKRVLEELESFYRCDYANIHRGAHFLGDRATEKYEAARKKIADFVNAKTPREIICTKNATESINLVARCLGEMEDFFMEGDRIILTRMEHHANMVPWLQLADRKKLQIEYIDFDADKNLILKNRDDLLSPPTKLLAFAHVSNVLGTENPAKTLCQKAKEKGVLSLVDACQSIPHKNVNVQEIECDLLTFSAHKMYGPSGVGFLYGKLDLLKKMPPFLGGGEMIREVTYDGFTPNEVPEKFEAGTPPIAEMVGSGAAVDFLQEIGMEHIQAHDESIARIAYDLLSEIPEVTVLSHKEAGGLITFTMNNGMQNYDMADYLSDKGICIRGGHHCAEPLHNMLGVKTSLRASFGVYTTEKEIEKLTETIKQAVVISS
jgi:cysteine desulfurase/selenocysteine lyase